MRAANIGSRPTTAVNSHLRRASSAIAAPRTMSGKAPLHVAAEHGRVGEVAALLADGANVDETTTEGFGTTALWFACVLVKMMNLVAIAD